MLKKASSAWAVALLIANLTCVANAGVRVYFTNISNCQQYFNTYCGELNRIGWNRNDPSIVNDCKVGQTTTNLSSCNMYFDWLLGSCGKAAQAYHRTVCSPAAPQVQIMASYPGTAPAPAPRPAPAPAPKPAPAPAPKPAPAPAPSASGSAANCHANSSASGGWQCSAVQGDYDKATNDFGISPSKLPCSGADLKALIAQNNKGACNDVIAKIDAQVTSALNALTGPYVSAANSAAAAAKSESLLNDPNGVNKTFWGPTVWGRCLPNCKNTATKDRFNKYCPNCLQGLTTALNNAVNKCKSGANAANCTVNYSGVSVPSN